MSRRDIVAVLARRDEEMAAELADLIGDVGRSWGIRVDDGVVSVSGVTSPSEREVVRVLTSTVPGAGDVRFTGPAHPHQASTEQS